MGFKRRGLLALLAGGATFAVKGSDEAAPLLARSGDELIEGGTKSNEETSLADKAATAGKRKLRRETIEEVLEDTTHTEKFDLSPGYYAAYKLSPSYKTQLSYSFETRLGTDVESFLLDSTAYEELAAGGEPQFKFDHWIMDSSGSISINLESGKEYYLIIDNTDAGIGAASDYIITISVEIRLQVH